MKRFLFIIVSLVFSGVFYAQSIKYKADVEPILSQPYNLNLIGVLESYYSQNLGPDKKPTVQALQYLKPKMTAVLLYIGHSYEKMAVENKNYPTTDSAISNIKQAVVWYEKVGNEFAVKSDTLVKHIAKIKTYPTTWTEENRATVRKIQEYKESFKSNILRIQVYDTDKASALIEKHKNMVYVNECHQAYLDSKDLLDDLERQIEIEEQKKREAAQKKAEIQENQAKENAQKKFLALQQKCNNENPSPNNPIDVAKQFRDAYYTGDVDAMKKVIIDYYEDQQLFYEKNINLYADLTEEQKQAYSLEFKAKTADYKKTDPVNVVYYSNNETKDFFIDQNYKSSLLHATVFQTINEWDKVDLVKYQGKWYVYRVGGAYGGRSGNTIVNGKFHLDSRFLQKEIKQKKK